MPSCLDEEDSLELEQQFGRNKDRKMHTTVKRGSSPNDGKEFGGQAIAKLHRAGKDLQYLFNQGYHIKGASTFVGNHYLLTFNSPEL